MAAGAFLPEFLFAQGVADEIHGLQGVLDSLYDEMIGLSGQLIGVGRGIAGFAAIWYIASRVWKHIANAEPIDFYPLFRPFCLGFCIMIFPSVLAMINGVMKPTVTGTSAMVSNSNKAIEILLKQKEEELKKSDPWKMYVGENNEGDKEKWYKYIHGEDASLSDQGMLESIGTDLRFMMAKNTYSFRNMVKEWMSEVLRVLYEAAGLCINTIRTFQLIVLAIVGPLVFGLAVFDGLQHTLTAWLARYINVFLWLPVANIFGAIISKIQENMIKIDLAQLQTTGDTFFSSKDMAYLVFMLIGIVGYFTVPSVANSIVNAGGGGGAGMMQRISSLITTGGAVTSVFGKSSGGSTIPTGATMSAGNAGNDVGSGDNSYMNDKLSGKV